MAPNNVRYEIDVELMSEILLFKIILRNVPVVLPNKNADIAIKNVAIILNWFDLSACSITLSIVFSIDIDMDLFTSPPPKMRLSG